MTSSPRILPVSGVKNFRDMGGYTAADGRQTRWGKLFRSGHLADLTAAEDVAGRDIHTVIDFRSAPEKERRPVRWPEGWAPDYRPSPIGGNAAAWIQELYARLADAPFPAKELRDQFILAFETIPIANAGGLKLFFDAIIDGGEKGGVLFHCTAGKDRTGVAGALLMHALGAGEEDIMADFLLTNDAVDIEGTSAELAEWLSRKAGREIAAPDVHPLIGVEPDFLKAAYASIGREYGTLDAYLEKAMGLSPERRKKLADLYLAE
ncbi:tyrosine-protein phosphatase [Kordiimonas marina]|uniref:tyrosine-protein phosphatase n=1 Tax=Kordiimonas marina TaxID=2872312 RepID=UPI001FF48528|nr:tyrosine-protein phosphatase [Kordiimonas marina]MCJ9428038.1 tyrosine-protein phosphatase [Kordiimonas marina]